MRRWLWLQAQSKPVELAACLNVLMEPVGLAAGLKVLMEPVKLINGGKNQCLYLVPSCLGQTIKVINRGHLEEFNDDDQ